ncbi:MAG: Isochorismate synthase MenF [Chlamydiae bacterium]|nr:Isochorismate synthase MenF [Chlamydiota bacterium]
MQRELPPTFSLLSWLEREDLYPKCYWRGRDGTEIAASGSLLTLDTPPNFSKRNTSSARFWGGQAFSPETPPKDHLWEEFPRKGFFLPKNEVIRSENRTRALSHSLGEVPPDPIETAPSDPFFLGTPLTLLSHIPSQEEWEASISSTLQMIGGSSLDKVVMGRRSTYLSEGALNPFALLENLSLMKGTLFLFQFSPKSAFLGATPERLYKRKGRHILTEAIAGTRPRGENEQEDLALEHELLSDRKEQEEFAYVKESITAALSPLCKTLSPEGEDRVIKTTNVQHLFSPFEGTLLPEAHDEAIIEALHPTAAMGGMPREKALEHLKENEPFERGWYASPLGFISADEAELAVGIRSALVKEDHLHLFAAAGIVIGSHPQKEWEEINHKMGLWL